MKTTLRLLAIVALALSIPACSSTPKSDCCGSGNCSVNTTQMHPAKQTTN